MCEFLTGGDRAQLKCAIRTNRGLLVDELAGELNARMK